MGIYSEAIQRLYVAYFNRPADPAGMIYWDQAITAAHGSTAAVSAAFAASDEYQKAYAGMDAAHVVNQVYLNLFGHNADAAGLDFWAKALANNQMTVSDAVTQIAAGAQGADKTAFQSKTTAATAFTNALDTTQETLAYAGDRANQIGKTFIAGVIDEASLQAAIEPANLDRVIASLSGSPWPPVFQLTTGVDHLLGTPGDDVFNALPFNPATGFADITMFAFDSVDGGAGKDTLNIQIASGRNSSFGTITNIETINITADAPTDIDASAFSGATVVRQIGHAGTVYGLGTGTAAAFQGSTLTGGLDVRAAGSAATVYLEQVSDAATLAVSGATLNTVTVTGARVHDGLAAAPAALNLAVTAGTDVQALSINSDQDIKLTINSDSASSKLVTSFNAGRSTGAISFDANRAPNVTTIVTGSGADTITATKTAGKALTIQAGAGNDVVYLTGAPETGDLIDGGGGSNTLIISGVDASQGAAISKLVTNFSSIQFVYPNASGNLDASLLSPSYGTINVNQGGVITNVGTQSLIANGNLGATAAGYDGEGAYGGTLQVTEKAGGTITAKAAQLALTVSAATGDVSAVVGGDLQSANVTLAAEDNHVASVSFSTGATSLSALKSLTLSGSGAADVTNGDGSKLVTVSTASLSNGHGLTYTSTNPLAESIYLGAGTDRVILHASTYGAVDTVYGLKLVVNANGSALAAGSDTLVVGGVSSSVKLFTTAQTDFDLVVMEAAASAKGDDLVFVFNGDAYVYHDTGSNNSISGDVLVKLAGVTDARAVILALGGSPG